MERIHFKGQGIEFKSDDDCNIFGICKRYIAKVIDCEEQSIKQAIIDYAKAKYKGENITLWLIDEKVAKEIIDLGIKEYSRRYNNE